MKIILKVTKFYVGVLKLNMLIALKKSFINTFIYHKKYLLNNSINS